MPLIKKLFKSFVSCVADSEANENVSRAFFINCLNDFLPSVEFSGSIGSIVSKFNNNLSIDETT